jgi:hypothetical protein
MLTILSLPPEDNKDRIKQCLIEGDDTTTINEL